jgi:hypothetical protein
VVPAFANRAQAVVLYPYRAAESHDTTVYWPATAVEQLTTSIAATAAPTKPLTRCLQVMPLIYSAEAAHARDKPSDRCGISATCEEREETRSGFSDLRAEIGALRQRTDAGFSEQYHQTLALHPQMIYIVVGFVVALIGLLGAAVAQL